MSQQSALAQHFSGSARSRTSPEPASPTGNNNNASTGFTTPSSPAPASPTPARRQHNPYAMSPSFDDSTESPISTPPPQQQSSSAMQHHHQLPAALQQPVSDYPNTYAAMAPQHSSMSFDGSFDPTQMMLMATGGSVSPPPQQGLIPMQPMVQVGIGMQQQQQAMAAAAMSPASFGGSGPFQQSNSSNFGGQQQQHPNSSNNNSRGGSNSRYHNNNNQQDEGTAANAAVVTLEELNQHVGELSRLARTAGGSSFIQAALRDDLDGTATAIIWNELTPELGDLLLDAHGGYVIKGLLDQVSPDQQQVILGAVTSDESLAYSMCTHSLHTRRVVQHVMETIDPLFLLDILTRRCTEIAPTQQGCIVLQRAMDNAAGPQREALFAAVASNAYRFACNPFANYVIQHLLEIGQRDATSAIVWAAIKGRVTELSCNKFASNVVEKCLFHVTADTQHEIITEMYSAGSDVLYQMLQDSFGNYIIQSSIALATHRDLGFINEKLRPVLAHVPYGHKIEARLERRLKGKPVTAKAGPGNGNHHAPRGGHHQQGGHHHSGGGRGGHHQGGRGGNGGRGATPSFSGSFDAVPAGEMPW